MPVPSQAPAARSPVLKQGPSGSVWSASRKARSLCCPDQEKSIHQNLRTRDDLVHILSRVPRASRYHWKERRYIKWLLSTLIRLVKFQWYSLSGGHLDNNIHQKPKKVWTLWPRNSSVDEGPAEGILSTIVCIFSVFLI